MKKNGDRVKDLCRLLDLNEFVLVDIGALGGFDKRWEALGSYLTVIGFEPNESEYKNLKNYDLNKNIKYYNICVSEKPSKLKFFELQKNGTSSCLKPNYHFLSRFPQSERFNMIKEINLKNFSWQSAGLYELS